jgi:hypothetical protein
MVFIFQKKNIVQKHHMQIYNSIEFQYLDCREPATTTPIPPPPPPPPSFHAEIPIQLITPFDAAATFIPLTPSDAAANASWFPES